MSGGGGTSLALDRRWRDRQFHDRYFVGNAIDIGAGPDSLGLQMAQWWTNLVAVRDYDKEHGDASTMVDVPNESFSLVYSSHCLEHIARPRDALRRWWQLVKPGGHLVLVVPDEDLYEQRRWPPAQNGDHRNSYTLWKADVWSVATNGWAPSSWCPQSVSLLPWLMDLPSCRIIKCEWLEAGFRYDLPAHDQTATGTCECGIEVVLRKEQP